MAASCRKVEKTAATFSAGVDRNSNTGAAASITVARTRSTRTVSALPKSMKAKATAASSTNADF
jgi:hypothetical protein